MYPIINCSYVKNNFYKIFSTRLAQNVPKIKNAQNLSKSGISNISSMPIFILMSKISFKKNLQPIRPKLVPKIKNAKDLSKFGTFDISNIPISILM